MPPTIDPTQAASIPSLRAMFLSGAPSGLRVIPPGLTLSPAQVSLAVQIIDLADDVEARRRKIAAAKGGVRNRGRERHDARALTPEQEAKLVAAKGAGRLTIPQLMAAFGVSRTTLYAIVRRHAAARG